MVLAVTGMPAREEASVAHIARDNDPVRPDGVDAEEFARRLRHFAADAYRILKDQGCSPDELIGLHHRAWSLLCDAPVATTGELHHWILTTLRAIGARLQSSTPEDPESLAA
jgi:hypothetical protein